MRQPAPHNVRKRDHRAHGCRYREFGQNCTRVPFSNQALIERTTAILLLHVRKLNRIGPNRPNEPTAQNNTEKSCSSCSNSQLEMINRIGSNGTNEPTAQNNTEKSCSSCSNSQLEMINRIGSNGTNSTHRPGDFPVDARTPHRLPWSLLNKHGLTAPQPVAVFCPIQFCCECRGVREAPGGHA